MKIVELLQVFQGNLNKSIPSINIFRLFSDQFDPFLRLFWVLCDFILIHFAIFESVLILFWNHLKRFSKPFRAFYYPFWVPFDSFWLKFGGHLTQHEYNVFKPYFFLYPDENCWILCCRYVHLSSVIFWSNCYPHMAHMHSVRLCVCHMLFLLFQNSLLNTNLLLRSKRNQWFINLINSNRCRSH